MADKFKFASRARSFIRHVCELKRLRSVPWTQGTCVVPSTSSHLVATSQNKRGDEELELRIGNTGVVCMVRTVSEIHQADEDDLLHTHALQDASRGYKQLVGHLFIRFCFISPKPSWGSDCALQGEG